MFLLFHRTKYDVSEILEKDETRLMCITMRRCLMWLWKIKATERVAANISSSWFETVSFRLSFPISLQLAAYPYGEGNGTPLQYSWLDNPMDGGAWWLQSMGSWRVGHDWATSLLLCTFMHWRRKWQPIPVFSPGESQGQRSLVGSCLWGHTESDTTEAT